MNWNARYQEGICIAAPSNAVPGGARMLVSRENQVASSPMQLVSSVEFSNSTDFVARPGSRSQTSTRAWDVFCPSRVVQCCARRMAEKSAPSVDPCRELVGILTRKPTLNLESLSKEGERTNVQPCR